MLSRSLVCAMPSFFRRLTAAVPSPKKTYEALDKELKDLQTEHLYTIAELENTRR
jgi:hypothetical protein